MESLSALLLQVDNSDQDPPTFTWGNVAVASAFLLVNGKNLPAHTCRNGTFISLLQSRHYFSVLEAETRNSFILECSAMSCTTHSNGNMKSLFDKINNASLIALLLLCPGYYTERCIQCKESMLRRFNDRQVIEHVYFAKSY